MPRSFDSDAEPVMLRFTELVDCPRCEERFEAEFVDYTQSLTFEDMTEAPHGTNQCPGCDLVFHGTMTGWMFYGEAG